MTRPAPFKTKWAALRWKTASCTWLKEEIQKKLRRTLFASWVRHDRRAPRKMERGFRAAVLFIAAMLAFDVNLVSSFMFPLVRSAWQESFSYFFRFAGVHILVVLLAGLFSFFAVFAVVGVLMIALPYQVFRRVSLYLRGA